MIFDVLKFTCFILHITISTFSGFQDLHSIILVAEDDWIARSFQESRWQSDRYTTVDDLPSTKHLLDWQQLGKYVI